jgi:two-component system, OmpR family, phosphate regulon sensor histidine kinase PhoR
MYVADSNLLEQLVEKSPTGILVTGVDGRLQVINPAAEEMITLIGEPIGRFPNEAIPIPDITAFFEKCNPAPMEREIEYGNRDLLVRSAELDPAGRLVILEDISTVKRAERSQREFVANVSHELRTPTTSIAGYAETLLSDGDSLDEDTRMMVEVIYRNAIRLNALFEDLLTLSRIEASDGPLEELEFSLLGIVQECVDKQSVRAEERRIQFHIFVSKQLLILANRDAMIHVVGNLIENAVKYSNEGGLVTIRASLREESVQLEVIDLGIGITPVHQKRIFDRFFRVDKARSRKVGGTGLGLAIVRQLVDRMGTRIEVRSRVGSGSIFRIYLKPAN